MDSKGVYKPVNCRLSNFYTVYAVTCTLTDRQKSETLQAECLANNIAKNNKYSISQVTEDPNIGYYLRRLRMSANPPRPRRAVEEGSGTDATSETDIEVIEVHALAPRSVEI